MDKTLKMIKLSERAIIAEFFILRLEWIQARLFYPGINEKQVDNDILISAIDKLKHGETLGRYTNFTNRSAHFWEHPLISDAFAWVCNQLRISSDDYTITINMFFYDLPEPLKTYE